MNVNEMSLDTGLDHTSVRYSILGRYGDVHINITFQGTFTPVTSLPVIQIEQFLFLHIQQTWLQLIHHYYIVYTLRSRYSIHDHCYYTHTGEMSVIKKINQKN